MNISFRTFSAIALTALLTACGAGQQETQTPMTLGAAVQSDLGVATAATVPQSTAVSTGPAVAAATGPNNPVPDCAAEGCRSLRIIDGNAEAYRIDAMRRAAAEGNGLTQS
ncbi:hypothetical protein MasN3_17210 [Massilia varians]|uniref:Lipoprotein n=1 Tax=Massilia varians TaxID=457921 RepID=A0ABM8C4V5_9BURK|nr:hypothetical protein [Massilia varians]BDT58227.1 hypothetical protein MasN3_17210 [Massilia varians]